MICESYDHMSCGSNQSQDGYFKLYWYRPRLAFCFSYRSGSNNVVPVWRRYVRFPTRVSLSVCDENLSWDIHLIVWRKFHCFCGTVVSSICVTQTTAFSCYGFHFMCVCMHGVFHATEKDSMHHGCVIVLL